MPQKETEILVDDIFCRRSRVWRKSGDTKRDKKKLEVPIYVDSNSDNEQSKKKCGPKFSMAEAIFEAKKNRC